MMQSIPQSERERWLVQTSMDVLVQATEMTRNEEQVYEVHYAVNYEVKCNQQNISSANHTG